MNAFQFRFDGMLGLAFEEIAVGQVTPPFHRAVQLGLLDQPIFTVFLKQVGREENVYGGTITYGGVDVEHCEQPVIYEPLTLPLWWQFKVKGVSTGRLNVKMDWEAVSDTSTNLIVGPPGLVKVIAMENGAQYSSFYRLYFISCDATPVVKLTIGGNQYTLTAANLLVEIEEDLCIFAFSESSNTEYGSQWILGDPFHREYCTIHDIQKKQIGFAKAKQE
ncbi:hypothetical protein Y032_0309g2068 [Ancylostoma ceylanicum]|uniref:Peptidase A1 domain-containing protein n=1 Tax=Ancylostoma ceylanicum TaxID=53326 RepID=A0A016S3A2_9BILA|nr:hypothetical protein Y032_0309g2068 [Ancylostoma ceylanicum]